MNNIKPFNKAKNTYFPTLLQYIPIVDKVHGKNHPEFHKVRSVFEKINDKTNLSQSTIPNLDEEFVSLKEITNNYTIPSDVCESFATVYEMLKAVDEAYYS